MSVDNLFTKIEKCHAVIRDGWCSLTKAHVLAGLIFSTRPRIVVEIGVWSGKSLIPMAIAMKETGAGGVVVGIDPFTKAASIEGMTDAHKEWWAGVDHDAMLQLFQKYVDEFGVRSVVQLQRVKSDNVDPVKEIGLIHLDGNHGEQALRDVQRFASNVLVGGFAVLDDLNQTDCKGWDGVSRSLAILGEMGFVERFRHQDTSSWGVFQKIKG